MKSLWKHFAVLLVSVAAISLYGQIGIALSLNRSVYMQYEHVFANVTLRNDSGRPLLFGKDPALQGFLLFEIRDKANRIVSKKSGNELSVTGLMLSPGEVRNVIVQLDRFYNLENPGEYSVHAYVSHNQLRHEYRCKDIRFTVSKGYEVWRRVVGVPDMYGVEKDGFSKERIYSVRQLNEGREGSYYLVVEDARRIYGVVRVGNYVGYEKFNAEVDMLSRIHLMMPIAPRIYHYLAFGVDGTPLVSSYWKSADTIPVLSRNNKTGKVTRIGGVRAIPGRDFVHPKKGKLSVTDILNREDSKKAAAPKYRGVVDLGKNAVPRLSDKE